MENARVKNYENKYKIAIINIHIDEDRYNHRDRQNIFILLLETTKNATRIYSDQNKVKVKVK